MSSESEDIEFVKSSDVNEIVEDLNQLSLSYIVHDWSNRELGRSMTMEEWWALEKERVEEDRKRKELLNSLVGSKDVIDKNEVQERDI
jgi:hypothetical protein